MRSWGLITAVLMVLGLAPAQAVADEPVTTPRFVTGEIPLRNARAGADYRATIGGLALGGGNRPLRFVKTGGVSWAAVSADGVVTGRPPADATDATVTVEAGNTAGQRASATLRIPVRPGGTELVPRLKVLSFNLWHGGTKVDNGREKQLKFLLEQDVDVVGLQEHMGNSAQELAAALGWDYHPGDNRVAILSRYPITQRQQVPSPIPAVFPDNIAISARIRIDDRPSPGGRHVSLWNTHQFAVPYGPWALCFGRWPAWQVGVQEQPTRGLMMRATLAAMAQDLRAARETPVLLTGDFNAPSHLDYTAATAQAHCGYDRVDWTASMLAHQAGLIDSFRAAHPDPARTPGNTWSPTNKVFHGGYGWDAHKGKPEPQDRIDFVYHAGGMKVLDSAALVVGSPRPEPDHADNDWPSDHAAVLTTFQIP